MASPSTRRLLKESTDLHKNPSPYFTASPVDDTNLHDWHFTLVGPPSPTPYAKGLYHGRITFPAAYPLRPPSFRFLTPSARFEVNREICLSISGHHEETWQPAWGVRTALLAIRSEIFSGESKGQVGGMEGSEELRREYAGLSRGWVCRECGGSNEVRMREFWELCREVGVKVDVEGVEGGDGDEDRQREGQDEEKDGQEKRTEPQQERHDLQDSSAPPIPQSVPVDSYTYGSRHIPSAPGVRPGITVCSEIYIDVDADDEISGPKLPTSIYTAWYSPSDCTCAYFSGQ
ncbi:unnamed protein product [Penicillium pancosmium]